MIRPRLEGPVLRLLIRLRDCMPAVLMSSAGSCQEPKKLHRHNLRQRGPRSRPTSLFFARRVIRRPSPLASVSASLDVLAAL